MRCFAVVLLAVGCGGGGLAASSALDGDWWECEAADCAAYRSDGVRFAPDGTYTGLVLGGLESSYSPGAAYCAASSDNDSGTYVFDAVAGTLAITNLRGVADSATVMFDGDLMHFPLTTFERIAPTNFTACAI